MKGRLIVIVCLLGVTSGCRDDGLGAPQISSLSPDAIPYYLQGQTLTVEGQGFLPQVTVRSREGGVDVTSDNFQVRLSPEIQSNDSCFRGDVYLSDVVRTGTTQLQGVLPEDLCPGSYEVEVVDPRGTTSQERPVLIISDSFPDQLRLFEGGCEEDGQELLDAPLDLSLDSDHLFSLKVVGPEGQPVAEMTPSLDGAAPLDQEVSLWLSSAESYGTFDLLSDEIRRVSDAPGAEEGGPLYAGTLSDKGCADFFLIAKGPGLLKITATPESLPGLGGPPAGTGQLRFNPTPDQWLEVMTPNLATAGVPFGITVTAMVGVEEPKLDTSLVGCLRFSVKDQAEATLVSNIEDTLGCAEGTLPMTGGFAAGTMTVLRKTTGTYLVAELVSAPEVDGLSDVFEVAPGPAKALTINELESVVAGEEFELRVGMVDAYGNSIAFEDDDDVALWYPAQDLHCGDDRVDASTGERIYPCFVTEAGSDQTIAVTYASVELEGGTIQKESAPFEVLPGPLAGLALRVPGNGIITSGEDFDLIVEAVDAYDNLVDGAVGGLDLSLDDSEAGDLVIQNAILFQGSAEVQVTIHPAGEQNLRVTFNTLESDVMLQVGAGPHVAFDLASGVSFPVEAGTSIGVTLRATDAYGNTATDVNGALELEVVDGDDEEIQVLSAPIFQGGIGGAVMRLTRAQEGGLIQVSDAAGHLGIMTGVGVFPGPHVDFDFSFDDAVWVNRPFQARISAVDEFGNLRADFEGRVRYTDRSNTLLPTQSGDFVGGVYDERFRIGQALADNALEVFFFPEGEEGGNGAESISAESPPFPVLQDCPEELGVTLRLLNLDNPERQAHCLDEPLILGTRLEAEAEVNFVGAGLALRYLWNEDSDSDGFRGGESTNSFIYQGAGHYQPSVTVWEPLSLCGASDVTDLYLGEDDHRPVGRLTLTASRDPIYTDGASQGTTTISVEGQTCRRDNLPTDAEPFSILAGTSYGVLEGLDTNPSVPGLQGIWNPSRGQQAYELDLSVVGQDQATTSRVALGTPSGSAFGALDVQVLNDTFAPYVVSFGPSGRNKGAVSQAFVRFSEPMHPDSLLEYGNVSVSLREGDGDLERLVEGEDYELALVQEDTYLRINFEPALELEGVEAEVNLLSAGGRVIADAGGEALNGNWDSHETYDESFRFTFGDIIDSTPPEVTSCAPVDRVYSPVTYIDPDWNEGGISFGLFLSDNNKVKAWRLGIYDVDDEPVYEMFGTTSVAPTVDLVVEWFGNRTSGPLVPNGTYWYEVDAMDVYGNFSDEPCKGTVKIENPFDFGIN